MFSFIGHREGLLNENSSKKQHSTYKRLGLQCYALLVQVKVHANYPGAKYGYFKTISMSSYKLVLMVCREDRHVAV